MGDDLISTVMVPAEGATKGIYWYLVGECPGPEEERMRRPFVGPAGQILRTTFQILGFPLQYCRIWNVVPWRTYEWDRGERVNRNPKASEIRMYATAVRADIVKVKPQVVVCLGGSAALGLFGHTGALEPIRGKVTLSADLNGIPVFVTNHPQYIGYGGGIGTDRWRTWCKDLRDCRALFPLPSSRRTVNMRRPS